MAKAIANGIQLHYQQFGKGPDIVMVHGITGNLAIWHLEIVPALMSEYRLTTYDLRGHGYSEVPPTGYTTADHANDLKNLLDTLGIERAHVLGHSFGADIALHFTILFPERVNHLVLVEPAIAALIHLREHEDWIGWKYWREKLALGGLTVPPEKWYDAEYLVRSSVSLPMLFGFRKGRARRAGPLVRLMDTTSAAKDYCDVAGMTLDKIAQIRHPTLLLYGEDSVFLGTYDFLRQNLANCSSFLMADSEHFGPIERPQLLLEHLRIFLHDSKTGSDGSQPVQAMPQSADQPQLQTSASPALMNVDRPSVNVARGEKVQGESILVTGASTGLGKETAFYLAERGFRVYATVREASASEKLLAEAKSRNVELRVMPLDVVNQSSIEHAVQTIVEETGGIYGVINNAGVGLRGYFEDLDDQEIRQMFDANVFGVMAVTKAALPHMRKARRGRILLISSVGGRIGSLGVSAYCSTKFAIEGFGESLFMELAPLGIRVSLIEPGIVKTERWSTNRGIAARAQDPRSPYYQWFQQSEHEADKLVKASTATPADVAAVIHRALIAERPKLRYMIGRKAKLAVGLRRWLPGNLFERIYFGVVMRRATQLAQPLNPRVGSADGG